MNILLFSFLECLRRLRWIAPASVGITAAVMYGWPVPPGMGEDAHRTAAMWLHVPALLVTAAGLVAAVEVWPLFARGRPGAGIVARLRPGVLGGCGAISAGALTALSLWLLGVGAAFAGLSLALGTAPGPLHAQYSLAPEGEFLDSEPEGLVAPGPEGVLVGALLLRPRSVLSRGGAFEPTPVTVRIDGEALHPGWLDLGGQLEDQRLSFSPRTIQRVEIHRAPGLSPVLFFGPDAIRAVSATAHSWFLGCVLAALTYLFPAALVLALVCLARERVAMPIVASGIVVVLAVSSLSELSPASNAITGLARGRWFPGEEPLRQIAPSLTAAALVIMLAMATGIRKNR